MHYKLYLEYVTFWGDVNKSKSQPLIVQHALADQFEQTLGLWESKEAVCWDVK